MAQLKAWREENVSSLYACADPEGGGRARGPDPLPSKNHKAIGIVAVLVKISRKITGLRSQRFAGGRYMKAQNDTVISIKTTPHFQLLPLTKVDQT